jgi:hypothetical protein
MLNTEYLGIHIRKEARCCDINLITGLPDPIYAFLRKSVVDINFIIHLS